MVFPLVAALFVTAGVSFAALQQTFEDGEDTTNWGNAEHPSTWTNGSVDDTFLDMALGGENAGTGSSQTQGFSREFKYNEGGVDVTDPYSMSMYFQIVSFDTPDGGEFYILDGNFGAENTGNIRLVADGEGGYVWQAKNGGQNDWDDFADITFALDQPYWVEFSIDPDALKYSVTLQAVDSAGNIQETETLFDLSFENTIIQNGNNGKLTFHIQASGGSANVQVDNINIQGVPEPTSAALLAGGMVVLLARRNRRR